LFGLAASGEQKQWNDVLLYAETWKRPCRRRIPATTAEAEAIDQYIKLYDMAPRLLYAKGIPAFRLIYLTTRRRCGSCKFYS